MVQRRALERMVARVQPGMSRDRAELADLRVGDAAVVDYVRVVAEGRLGHRRSCADGRPGAEGGLADVRSGIDARLLGQWRANGCGDLDRLHGGGSSAHISKVATTGK